MQTLDYAVMNHIGGNGHLKEEAVRRLSQTGYDGSSRSNYHVLFVINTIRVFNTKPPTPVHKEMDLGLETFSTTGAWKCMQPEGWPEVVPGEWAPKNTVGCSSSPVLYDDAPSFPDLAVARKILTTYVQRDAQIKMLAVVGYDNLNVTDPRSKAYEYDPSWTTKEGKPTRPRFAHRGEHEYRKGVLVLPYNADRITIEDLDEAPVKLAQESLDFFLRVCESLVEPRLLHNEFGKEVQPR